MTRSSLSLVRFRQQKTHNLFWPGENSIEQRCAAHIVQGCQQYNTEQVDEPELELGVTMLNNMVDNLEPLP